MSVVDRMAVVFGALSVAVATVAIVGAAVLTPEFTLAGSALSDLGRPAEPASPLFNYGLILSGILALPLAALLLLVADQVLERLGALAFGLAAISQSLVGVFPAGHSNHFPVAVSFFILLTYTLWLYGTGSVLAGERERGVATIWLGIAHVTSWLAWAAGVRVGPGLAIPELVGALILAGWVLDRVRFLHVSMESDCSFGRGGRSSRESN